MYHFFVVAISQGLQWCVSGVEVASVEQEQFSIRSVVWIGASFFQAYPQAQFSNPFNSSVIHPIFFK